MSTLEKKIISAQHNLWSKKKFGKPQFQGSFSSGLHAQHVDVELRAARGQRRCYGCEIENKARGSSARRLARSTGHTSLNVATRECCHQNPELAQLAVADSKWKKKSSEPFPGILELRFGKRRGCLVECWQLLLSSSHSNILDVTRPQTNSGIVCVSLCAGQVLFHTVYLLVEGTCAWTKKRDIFLFETRTGDEKDDKNSLQRFGVLHLLQRARNIGRIRSWLILPIFLSKEGVAHRNVGDYSCYPFRHPFVSQIKIYPETWGCVVKSRWPKKKNERDRTGSFKGKETRSACARCIDAWSCGQSSVNATKNATRTVEKAIAVLPRRCSEILERCIKLFSLH